MRIVRHRRRAPLLPTTSMGDIAFLLIIFFMLTSNFIKEAHVDMQQAASKDVERLKESQISVSIDKAGKLWLQGKPCEEAGLEGAVRELVGDRPEPVVMLKVDRTVAQETYGAVLLALSKAEVEIALVGDRVR